MKPQEWFLAPLSVIDEVVSRIKDQTIIDFEYDVESASLKQIDSKARGEQTLRERHDK